MVIKLKSDDEILVMREAGRIVANTLAHLREMIRPGLNVMEIEKFVREEYKRVGAKETFLNYAPGGKVPYPSNICVSINDELVHGIPRNRILQEGDIVSLDLGATYNGYVGDSAITVPVGKVNPIAEQLIEVTEASLWAGIKAARPGAHLNDVRGAIEDTIRKSGFSIVKGYGGHGVGRDMHEEPHVENFRQRFKGPKLQPGLVLALEPMVNVGGPDVFEGPDGWTVSTKDGSLCCHFEHTIAIRAGGEAEVLTLP
ncbi:MAG: type I methionyl aminopeptidase [Dehalococcoidia bacterium]|jgi:methionyl aminopeptidase|uniref:type I methionyl aminopeptidase n=1 Tax=Candidatus Amarobacter glycogenicus TaxID=3140699 RepID=UPI002A0D0FFD|nr:type I methionyl aminopeptidase [Dehalococcoidia bacterium]MBK6563483.1 type I methionyl aminopeptidase [Dehalococcoidia bacterium]MBK7127528.1 type I methionyl aminopeptidase [Dehalococcoidia bacterium]MBK7330240.1 type I methionyl aminopeptidase [Dehalococcoidia bacterium]MBK8560092.1 type I methionyl aminopeptidase [Dehalococcoidia bacterium]